MAGNTQTDTSIPMDARIGAHLRSLADVSKGKSALLTCRVAGLDYPDHIWTGDPVKVTPAQARAALKRFRKAAMEAMPNQASDMPEDIEACLKVGYTVRAGKNRDGTPRPERKVDLFAYALNRVRRAHKRLLRKQKAEAEVKSAEADGGAWFAEGVDRPWGTEAQARKAWARTHVGPNWWEDKEAKAGILAKAVISRGEAFGDAPASTPAPKTTKVQTTSTVTVKSLRASCKALGLKTTGTKAELMARISQHTLGL